MDKRTLLKIVNQISEILLDRCESDKEIEQVQEGVEKYIEFSKSIPQT